MGSVFDLSFLDRRPLLVAIAGPNGAGKSTFYHAFLKSSGLRFVNADVIAKELDLDAYKAAEAVSEIRKALVEMRESFIFETVFSDPVGDKVQFLKAAATAGYTVVLCFIGLDCPETADIRVSMRISQGGHDVPCQKLRERFPRTMTNLRAAISELPTVLIYDNSDLGDPFRRVAVYRDGKLAWAKKPQPKWLP